METWIAQTLDLARLAAEDDLINALTAEILGRNTTGSVLVRRERIRALLRREQGRQ